MDFLKTINEYQNILHELDTRKCGTTTKLAQLLVLNYGQETDTYIIVKDIKRKDNVRHILKDLGHEQLEKYVLTLRDIDRTRGLRASFIFDTDVIHELTSDAKQCVMSVLYRTKEVSKLVNDNVNSIETFHNEIYRTKDLIKSHESNKPSLLSRIIYKTKYNLWVHDWECLHKTIERNKTYIRECKYKLEKNVRDIDFDFNVLKE